MSKKHDIKLSKSISLLLRHKPELGALHPDAGGWVDMDALLSGLRRMRRAASKAEVLAVVHGCPKQRFNYDADGDRIRANQGHSIRVDLDLEAQEPPALLFHGTAARYVDSILRDGLHKGDRHHVHLSPDQQTAVAVGERRGPSVILQIDARRMHQDGFAFYCSENGVWLADHVPARYLRRLPNNNLGGQA